MYPYIAWSPGPRVRFCTIGICKLLQQTQGLAKLVWRLSTVSQTARKMTSLSLRTYYIWHIYIYRERERECVCVCARETMENRYIQEPPPPKKKKKNWQAQGLKAKATTIWPTHGPHAFWLSPSSAALSKSTVRSGLWSQTLKCQMAYHQAYHNSIWCWKAHWLILTHSFMRFGRGSSDDKKKASGNNGFQQFQTVNLLWSTNDEFLLWVDSSIAPKHQPRSQI